MSTRHVISALVAKRAKLSGLMINLDRQLDEIKSQVNHIDHALAIFDYQAVPSDIKPVRPIKRRFKKREIHTLIRQFTTEGITNPEIAQAIIAHKGWDTEDRDLLLKIADSVKSAKNWASRKRRELGLVKSALDGKRNLVRERR